MKALILILTLSFSSMAFGSTEAKALEKHTVERGHEVTHKLECPDASEEKAEEKMAKLREKQREAEKLQAEDNAKSV